MKETYKSPELELLCLAPAERLANSSEIDYDILAGGQGGGSTPLGDTEIDIPL